MCKMLSERILCPLNWSQHRFLVHEMRVVALRRILWLSLMPIAAFYGFHFQGYPFDSHFAGGRLSGSECSPRLVAISLVAISPVAIFLAVTGAPRCADVEDEGSSPLVAAQTEVPLRMCREGFPGRKCGF